MNPEPLHDPWRELVRRYRVTHTPLPRHPGLVLPLDLVRCRAQSLLRWSLWKRWSPILAAIAAMAAVRVFLAHDAPVEQDLPPVEQGSCLNLLPPQPTIPIP